MNTTANFLASPIVSKDGIILYMFEQYISEEIIHYTSNCLDINKSCVILRHLCFHVYNYCRRDISAQSFHNYCTH